MYIQVLLLNFQLIYLIYKRVVEHLDFKNKHALLYLNSPSISLTIELSSYYVFK